MTVVMIQVDASNCDKSENGRCQIVSTCAVTAKDCRASPVGFCNDMPGQLRREDAKLGCKLMSYFSNAPQSMSCWNMSFMEFSSGR